MNYQSHIVRGRLEWNEYTGRSLLHEVYHTWEYHTMNVEGEPLMFVFLQGVIFIALPVIKRIISGTTYFDLTSVYGYAGPISNIDLSMVTTQTASSFREALDAFMKTEQCICLFSRLHPLLNQEHLLKNIGGLRENGQTIYIDLQQSLEGQHLRYHKRLLRQVRALRQRGFSIREATTSSEVSGFADMYRKNMDRLNASESYYFDEGYFQKLLDATEFSCKLILIYKDADMICGAMIFLSDAIIRNHLSATDPEFLSESPSKLLTDEISNIGRKQRLKVFHLGGGVSGKQDSLFTFKSYFSDLRLADKIWCYVRDQVTYNELAAASEVAPSSSFFPIYRAGRLKEIIK
ncbi:hypothetical protein PBAL39_01977 [Pedobacter sp. BAL39]|uniref:GNAT family N-acetyltransferase n=1 Tax=Pedobacter sp. BAL39 TaxID=391596 RepID=UPI0001559B93|nr:GNAT family N-acetyltransferase [Pedobacter sp. BAL39]EDM38344.1 hypothetical protein PBAL39_01977 [Pedobacter sp. BAL39]